MRNKLLLLLTVLITMSFRLTTTNIRIPKVEGGFDLPAGDYGVIDFEDGATMNVKSTVTVQNMNTNKNVYIKMGFELVEISKPEYRYYNEKVDKYKRFHKFGFRKNILMKKYGKDYNLDLSMTETEMVKILGYDRIWDCGLLKYKLTF